MAVTRDDERTLWILALLLLFWFLFRRAGFQFSGGVGPVGVAFGVGTSGFTGLPNGTTAPMCWGCPPEPTGPIGFNVGNYAQQTAPVGVSSSW